MWGCGCVLNLPLVGRSKYRSAAKIFRVGVPLRTYPHPKNLCEIFRPPHKGEVKVRLRPKRLDLAEFFPAFDRCLRQRGLAGGVPAGDGAGGVFDRRPTIEAL